MYTSPHLTSLRERIVVDGEPISEAALVEVAARARGAGNDDLTFFEQITVLAFMAFADAGPDITVLEVGLGGRLDATNVVSAEVAVVTGIALDHQDMLGDTLSTTKGLPEPHGIEMRVTKGGRRWFAWRTLPSGWVLGIGASGPPPRRRTRHRCSPAPPRRPGATGPA